MPSILILNMSNQQANGNISNLHCCAQTAKGSIVILLDNLCFEHAKYLSPFIKRTQPTAHTTLSSKLLSVTAKRMYAFWTINTMPPCPHAINSDSQHVQSASERKHLQSSLLCSDSQGKHCHPTGQSLFRTCKIPKSFHQANTTHCPYHFIVKATLSHSQANVRILDDQYHAAMPPCHQFWFSTCPISKRTETSPIFTAVLRQPREAWSSYWTLFVSNMQNT